MSAIVETNAGKVEGSEEDGLNIFKGIPYAAPPVGERRWLPPEATEPWSGVRPAQAFGNAAPQVKPVADVLAMDLRAEQNEDCLYLNVYTPGLDNAKRPVFFWIHGGGFNIGAGSQAVYDGVNLAKHGDIVVVTINYRLGPLGFINLNEVTAGRIPATGNEGLLDQVAALVWVRDNISAFGGDPDRVTIAGESAGGMSVSTLLALPKSRGLFHQAIPQSGAASAALSPEKSRRITEHYLDLLEVSANDADKLLSTTTDKLLAAAANLIPTAAKLKLNIGGMPFQPAIDGTILPKFPLDAIAAGAADGIPILTGTILEEWKLFAPMDRKIKDLDEAGLLKRCRRLISENDAEPVVAAYRKITEQRGMEATPGDIFTMIQTDRVFRMPTVHLAETCRQRGTPAFNYLFTWTSPAFHGLLGACHALELGFVFGTYNDGNSKEFYGSGPAADALAEKVRDAWLAFVRTGDPSCDSLGQWPVYSEKRETMMLGENCGLEIAAYEDERKAWDSVPNSAIGSL
ncbi:MAG: carboxylesterase/lipase family protein [Proteobacteria bacterium]|nr:carboxylesterase/lipase family protein [Pseudomonadota bacterium]